MRSPRRNRWGRSSRSCRRSKVNVKNKGEWNTFRIVMDWPRFRVWTNGEPIQDLDVETVPELRHRLRSGYLGLESLSYPIRFRNLRVRELPSKVHVDPAVRRGPRTSRSGMSRTASPNSKGSAPCFIATALGHSRRTRNIATSNSRCTCGTPGITTAACCSAARAGNRGEALRDPVARRGGRALSDGVAVLGEARASIRGSKPGSGGCFNCA